MHHTAMPQQYCEIQAGAHWQIQGAFLRMPGILPGKHCFQIKGDRNALFHCKKILSGEDLMSFSENFERIKDTQLVIDHQPVLHILGIQDFAVSYKSGGYYHRIVNA